MKEKTWLENVLFSVYCTKFWTVNLTWPEHKLLSKFAYILWGKLVFVVIIHVPDDETALERANIQMVMMQSESNKYKN